SIADKAAYHLLESATLRTKGEGSDAPLELLAKQFGDHTAEVMKKLGLQDEKLEVLRKSMAEEISVLDQKHSRGGYGGSPSHTKSVGDSFVESDGFVNFIDVKDQKNARPGEMRLKASLTTATTNAAGSVG